MKCLRTPPLKALMEMQRATVQQMDPVTQGEDRGAVPVERARFLERSGSTLGARSSAGSILEWRHHQNAQSVRHFRQAQDEQTSRRQN
jgi:hypothetical protein